MQKNAEKSNIADTHHADIIQSLLRLVSDIIHTAELQAAQSQHTCFYRLLKMQMQYCFLNKIARNQSDSLELNAQLPVLVFLVEIVRAHDIGFPWTGDQNHPIQSGTAPRMRSLC